MVKGRAFWGSAIAGVGLLLSMPTMSEDWVYTVKPGDTLWDLCLTYTSRRNCWQEVGPYNGVDYPPSMAPGTRVRFPVAWLKMQPTPATLLFFTGDVRIQAADQIEQPAVMGQTLTMGSAVRTGEGAASIQFADGALLFLESNSELVLDRLSRHSSTGMVDTQLRLNQGAGRAKVPMREPRSAFRIATPSAIAAVRGTQYRVSAEADRTLSAVYESTVQVSTGTGSVDVPERFGVVANKDEPLGTPEALLPAVTFNASPEWLAADGEVTWGAITGSLRYRVEWLNQGDNAGIVFAEQQAATTTSLPAALVAGQCYDLQVRAISASGLQGMPALQTVCVAEAPTAITGVQVKRRLLRWDAVPNAVQYRIEVSAFADFRDISQQVVVAKAAWQLPVPSRDGKAYVRISAVDERGVALAVSEPVPYSANSPLKAVVMATVFVVIAIL